MSLSNKRSGFTLIELLVVISIIALLSSVVLAALNGAKKKAQLVAVAQQFHQLQNAMEIYKISSGGTVPYGDYSEGDYFIPALAPLVTSGAISSIKSTPFPASGGHGLVFGYMSREGMDAENEWFGCGQKRIPDSYVLYVYSVNGNNNGPSPAPEYNLNGLLPVLYDAYPYNWNWTRYYKYWCLSD
jgi:prepilin-type N-terminal cleavage/methylation domain-containing protein